MAFLAQDFYWVVLAAAGGVLALRGRARWREWGLAAVLIGGLAWGIAQVATRLIQSPRPFLESGRPPLIPSAQDNGFPSDHTLLLAAVAAVVTLVDRRAGLLFWALALGVGLARVYAGVHHLLDVGGSLGIAGLALGLYLLGRRAWGARHPPPGIAPPRDPLPAR